jgi:hypothetical protein
MTDGVMGILEIMDEVLGLINWDSLTVLLHLLLSVPLIPALGIKLLGWLVPLWMQCLICASFFVYLSEDYLPLGSKVKASRYKVRWYWSKYRDRLAAMTMLLYATRLSRLLIGKPNKTPYLPPELWEIILKSVIEVPFVFDTQCDAMTFHAFMQAQNCLSVPYRKSYLDAERRRRQLRLVCKMWAELMDRPHPRWIFDCSSAPPHLSADPIKRLDLQMPNLMSETWAPHFLMNQQKQLLDPMLTDIQTRRAITSFCVTMESNSLYDEEAEAFLSNMRHLPQLQALTYIDFSEFPSDKILTELRYPEFASLTSLYMKIKEVQGSLRLQMLEVLYLDVDWYNSSQWSFPSLRHLAVKKRSRNFLHPQHRDNLGAYICPLAGSLTQLRSLFLLEVGVDIAIDALFWEDYPHLENLGVSSKRLTNLSHPPLDHPLNQITFTDKNAEYHDVMFLPTVTLNIRQIYLPSYTRHILESDTTELILLEACLRHNIRWLSDDGEVWFRREVILDRKRSPTEQFIWFIASLHSYATAYFYYQDGKWCEPFSLYHQGHVLVIMVLFALWRMGRLAYDRYVSPRYGWVPRYH